MFKSTEKDILENKIYILERTILRMTESVEIALEVLEDALTAVQTKKLSRAIKEIEGVMVTLSRAMPRL